MLHLFEYDNLFLLSKKAEFRYPLYEKTAKTIFLLDYKVIKENWLPPEHQELFEKIILSGFKYTLEEVVAYNVQEIIQNNSIEVKTIPEVVFYMENNIPEVVKKWINKRNWKIKRLPSLTQMIAKPELKKDAWKEIKSYLDSVKKENL